MDNNNGMCMGTWQDSCGHNNCDILCRFEHSCTAHRHMWKHVACFSEHSSCRRSMMYMHGPQHAAACQHVESVPTATRYGRSHHFHAAFLWLLQYAAVAPAPSPPGLPPRTPSPIPPSYVPFPPAPPHATVTGQARLLGGLGHAAGGMHMLLSCCSATPLLQWSCAAAAASVALDACLALAYIHAFRDARPCSPMYTSVHSHAHGMLSH